MDEEFEYMVTPLVFNLQLNLNATGYEIEKVYGSPEADEATGEIMKVNTLFPSKAQAGQVKGGIILIKLKKISPEGEMRLRVSYEDRNGTLDSDEADVMIGNETPDFYQNSGIRKAVLLSRYADLLKNWMIDERSGLSENKVMPSVTLENGIVVPVVLGEWERQSLPLVVSEPYRMLFGNFSKYFEAERAAIGDPDLQQEQVILDKLGSYEAKVTDQGQKSSSPDKIEDKGAWLKELRKLVREGLGIGS
jgi:Ca-activated chloride channel family protein